MYVNCSIKYVATYIQNQLTGNRIRVIWTRFGAQRDPVKTLQRGVEKGLEVNGCDEWFQLLSSSNSKNVYCFEETLKPCRCKAHLVRFM